MEVIQGHMKQCLRRESLRTEQSNDSDRMISEG